MVFIIPEVLLFLGLCYISVCRRACVDCVATDLCADLLRLVLGVAREVSSLQFHELVVIGFDRNQHKVVGYTELVETTLTSLEISPDLFAGASNLVNTGPHSVDTNPNLCRRQPKEGTIEARPRLVSKQACAWSKR